MTFAGLLSNLGGSLGLIVSVSVFILFEIVELFFPLRMCCFLDKQKHFWTLISNK